MEKIYHIVLILVMLFFIAPIYCSCGTVEHKYYIHPQTDNFYENMDFNNPKLKEFALNGVVFIPMIQAATHEEYWIRIGAYSLKPKQIKITDAIIYNPAKPEIREKITVNKRYTLDKPDKESSKSIYESIVMLWKLKNDTIDKLTGNNMVVLKVVVTTDQTEKQKKTIEFRIERKIDKYVKWLSQ